MPSILRRAPLSTCRRLLLGILICGGLPPLGGSTANTLDADAGAPDLHQLRSLPYGGSTPLAEQDRRSGVRHWDRARASPGLNLIADRDGFEVELVDLGGTVRHRWHLAGRVPTSPQHVELLPGGDLVVLCKDEALIRFGWFGDTIWRLDGAFHHEIHVTVRGDAWSVVRRRATASSDGRTVPFLEDVLVRVDLDHGRILQEVPLARPLEQELVPRLRRLQEAFETRGADGVDPYLEDGFGDLLHVNSVYELERDVAGIGRAGDLLVSPRGLDRLFALRPGDERAHWSWGEGALDGQHHATVTAEGRVLVFDNGRRRWWSRVLEVEPLAGKVVWSYVARDRSTFFSGGRGAAQRLANGNTLITESDFGRVFEVDPEGATVWEMFAPLVAGEDSAAPPRRATLYRARRIEGPLLDSIRHRLRRSGA